MSKADEMFKELGYEITTANYNVEEECIIYENKNTDYIYFSLENKGFSAYSNESRYKCGIMHVLEMQELQAINEKVKELGWI